MTEPKDVPEPNTTTPSEGEASGVRPYVREVAEAGTTVPSEEDTRVTTGEAATTGTVAASTEAADAHSSGAAGTETGRDVDTAFTAPPDMPAPAAARARPAIPGWLKDPIIQCLVATGVLSAIFLAVPALDTWFTGLFYEEGQGFPVARLGFFWGIRELHSLMTWAIAIIAGFPVLWKFIRPLQPSLIPPRATLFILGTLAIGPGLVVNGLFKSNWGRPRPYTVDLFGGQNPFVGVWEITDYCNRNCSFISGESSSAIWLITAAVLVPPAWRPLTIRLMVGLGIIFALNRIAFGGHFLSDVLLAWFITLAIIAFAWRILYVNPPSWLTDEVLEARGTRNALWLHRLFRRRNKETGPDEAP